MGTIIKNIQVSSKAEARIVISEKNWLETIAIDQLKKTAELPGMLLGVGQPDLHPGKGQPIGASFISKGLIYPHLVGSDIGCGMGLWTLGIPAKRIKLDRWVSRLTGLDDPWEGDRLRWLNEEIAPVFDGDLTEVDSKIGTIGGGNHFVEIQKVHEVYDGAKLAHCGLRQQSVVLLVHSGSRGLGQRILRDHINLYGTGGLVTDPAKGDVSVARAYIEKHDYAIKWAVANRTLIAKRFCDQLGVGREKVLDVTHNFVCKMASDCVGAMNPSDPNEDDVWIHRKGANPTDKGVVMIPGSRGSLSYLVEPRCDDVHQLLQGGFSLAHGAGRKWKRSDVKGRLESRYGVKDLSVTAFGSRIICKHKGLLYEEAPQAYKNIDTVISDMVDANMIDIVASFSPLITYKTRKS